MVSKNNITFNSIWREKQGAIAAKKGVCMIIPQFPESLPYEEVHE